MHNLINIVDKNGVPFIKSIKDLYISVGMNKGNWSTWYKRNVLGSIFFKENIDYERYSVIVESNETIDFACSLDMGKNLVLQMPTENAHKYRKYLIDYEKKNPLGILLSMNKESLAMTCLQLTTVIKEKDELIEQKETQLAEQAPLVTFADTLLKSKSSILIGDFSKILCEDSIKIGEGRLFDWLREKKYLYKENNINKPYQQYLDSGLFEVKTGVVKSAFRDIQTFTTKITPKGQLYFYNKIKEDGRFTK